MKSDQHLSVISPLVRHEHGGGYWAAVWVRSSVKQSGVELAVQFIDRIVEREEDELRDGVGAEAARDGGSTAAGRQPAVGGAAALCRPHCPAWTGDGGGVLMAWQAQPSSC